MLEEKNGMTEAIYNKKSSRLAYLIGTLSYTGEVFYNTIGYDASCYITAS